MIGDTGIQTADLTHAGAVLLGLGVGVYLTIRVLRTVLDVFREDRRQEDPDDGPSAE